MKTNHPKPKLVKWPPVPKRPVHSFPSFRGEVALELRIARAAAAFKERSARERLFAKGVSAGILTAVRLWERHAGASQQTKSMEGFTDDRSST